MSRRARGLALLVGLAILGFSAAFAGGNNGHPCHRDCTTTGDTTSSTTDTTTSDTSASTTTTTTSASLTITTTTATTTGAPFPQGIYTRGSNVGQTDAELQQLKALGFDYVFADPDPTVLDRLNAYGLKAAIWLGNYRDYNDPPPNCVWNTPDDVLTQQIRAVKDKPATAYYFIADEPHVGTCTSSPDQIRARNALIKSIDPTHPTFITENRNSDYAALANTTDIMGLVGYPCSYTYGCRASVIQDRINAANAAGIQHYWAMPQIDGDSYYRMVAPSELQWIYDTWRNTPGSRIEGELTFLWDGASCCDGLANHPELDPVVQLENAR